MADVRAIIGEAAARYNLDPAVMTRVAQIESGLNPNAKNPNSSAGGLYQFIDSTARNYGLTNKFDPVAAADAAARLLQDNRAVLSKALGREPTGAELYLAHQQGAGGAAKLLSNPNAPASNVVGADAVRLNGGSPDWTAGQFAKLWESKFDGAPTQMASAIPSAQPQAAAPMMLGAPAVAAPAQFGLGDLAALFAGQQQDVQQRQADQKQAELTRRQALFAPDSVAGLYGAA